VRGWGEKVKCGGKKKVKGESVRGLSKNERGPGKAKCVSEKEKEGEERGQHYTPIFVIFFIFNATLYIRVPSNENI